MNWSPNPALETTSAPHEDALTALMRAASQRILLLDGAMGTQIQCLNLDETRFRGDRFHSCDRLLQGNNDLLTLTQPQAIEDIHLAYALAGRGHSRNQHLLLDLDRAGGLRNRGSRL